MDIKTIVEITGISETEIKKLSVDEEIALNSTIGMSKVKVVEDRIKDINSSTNVTAIMENITSENIEEILKDKKIDYIVDCVDNFAAKVAIIEYANKNVVVKVLTIPTGNVSIQQASELYEIIEE